MTFFSIAVRVALAVFVLELGACSSSKDTELYGYEEDFFVPEPDMVPVTPDDKPGRTVDEMLNLAPPSVTVKKKEYASVSKDDQVYERTGRFGSKEKISLRKGLNAPDAGIVYGSQKRKDVQELRALEVKKQEKDELQAVSEEELLTRIISPKTTELELIEVVPASSERKEFAAKDFVSAEVAAPSTAVEKQKGTDETFLLSAPGKSIRPPSEIEREEIILLKPPAVLKDKKVEERQEDVLPILLKAPVPVQERVILIPPQERVILTPPQEEIIFLRKPEIREGDSSVEVFLMNR